VREGKFILVEVIYSCSYRSKPLCIHVASLRKVFSFSDHNKSINFIIL